VVLQFVIDDSGNEPQQELYVLAGYLSSSEAWSELAIAWDQLNSNASTRVEYAKYSEAMRLRGQFDTARGWTEGARDEHVEELCRLIRQHALGRCHAAMRHDHFAAYVRSVAVPFRSLISDHPYVFLAGRLLSAAATMLAILGLDEPCEFVFDTQPGQDRIIEEFWPSVTKTLENPPPALLVHGKAPKVRGPPRFESDRDFIPLQAADLLAGVLRKALLDGEIPRCMVDAMEPRFTGFVLDEAGVRDLGARLTTFVSVARTANPALPNEHFDARTAKRKRKLARRTRR